MALKKTGVILAVLSFLPLALSALYPESYENPTAPYRFFTVTNGVHYWGYKATNGSTLVPAEYLGASVFNGGWACLLKVYDRKTGAIGLFVVNEQGVVSPFRVEALYSTLVTGSAVPVYYLPGDHLSVLDPRGLCCYAGPDTNFAAVTNIPFGSIVTVAKMPDLTNYSVLDGVPGYWLYADFGGASGFLFDGFLSKMEVPPADGPSFPLNFICNEADGALNPKSFEMMINPDGGGMESARLLQDCSGCGVFYYQKVLQSGASTDFYFYGMRLDEVLLHLKAAGAVKPGMKETANGPRTKLEWQTAGGRTLQTLELLRDNVVRYTIVLRK